MSVAGDSNGTLHLVPKKCVNTVYYFHHKFFNLFYDIVLKIIKQIFCF